MKKQDSQNEKLDRIAKVLLTTARTKDEEIEKIVSAPELFNSVKARIKTEERARETKGFFGSWKSFQIWNLQKAFSAFAVLAVLLSGAVGLIVFRKQIAPQVAEQTAAPSPQNQSQVSGVEISDSLRDFNGEREIGEQQNAGGKNQKTIQKAAYKNERAQLRKPVRRQNFARRQPRPESEIEGKFYPLNYTETAEETGENEQVVRVQLSRSSLLALGVNMPLENETEKIKTDLLIGSDGVVKGVRFIK
jgi:hypothetical protein